MKEEEEKREEKTDYTHRKEITTRNLSNGFIVALQHLVHIKKNLCRIIIRDKPLCFIHCLIHILLQEKKKIIIKKEKKGRRGNT